MIQDIFPKKLHNQFSEHEAPGPDGLVLSISGRNIAVRMDTDQVIYPKVADYPEGTPFTYLFKVDETAYYMPDEEHVPAPAGFDFMPVNRLRALSAGPMYQDFAAFTGVQLERWYRDNRFCGRCGTATVPSQTERALVCPHCGRTIYPKIQPAVIVAILDPETERIVLTKYADRPLACYALVAGFTEIGETLEETVAREVMEEVGLKVKHITYYKSQPWGIADDILMGFFCEVDGDRTIRLDHHELKEGAWMTPEQVELQPDTFSLTNEMMTLFKEGRVRSVNSPYLVRREW